jgi:hypothetical protein
MMNAECRMPNEEALDIQHSPFDNRSIPMDQIHDRYKRTFDVMQDELAVINWRWFTELNVDGFVRSAPGIFMLGHTSGHDQNMVNPPYYIGKAGDLKAELFAQANPADAELAKHARIGKRWFKVVYTKPEELDARYEELKAKWAGHDGHAGRDLHGAIGANVEQRGGD